MVEKKQKVNEKEDTIRIENGLFFKDDFKKLPNDVIIYIKKGFLMRGKK